MAVAAAVVVVAPRTARTQAPAQALRPEPLAWPVPVPVPVPVLVLVLVLVPVLVLVLVLVHPYLCGSSKPHEKPQPPSSAHATTQATPKPHPALGQAATTTTNCKQCTRTDERGKWVGHGHRLTLAPHESSRFRRSTTTPRLQ